MGLALVMTAASLSPSSFLSAIMIGKSRTESSPTFRVRISTPLYIPAEIREKRARVEKPGAACMH